MTSPSPPHTLNVEIFVNGAWTSIPSDVYQRDVMSITRGYSSETSKSVNPAQLTATLDDRSRNYSPRNPNSIYYGSFKRNMPVRVSVSSGGTNYRFVGEAAALTPSADLSGKDLMTALEAGGLLRRLNAGAQTVQSRPRTYLPTTSPTAYWPMEDGTLSTLGVAAVGAFPMTHLGTAPQNWGATAMAVWLAPTVTGYYVGAPDGTFLGKVTAAAGAWVLDFMVSGNGPFTFAVSSDVGNPVFGGNQYTLSYTPSITTLTISGPATGAGSQSFTLALAPNVSHHLRFAAQESGSNVPFQVYVDGTQAVSSSFTGNAPLPSPLGIVVNTVSGIATPNTTGITFGHVAFWGAGATAPTIAAAVDAANGSPGEAAGTRIGRICTEQGVTLTTVGTLTATRPCGPQYVIGVVDLLQESADVDGGLLYETLTSVGLTYTTRDALYNAAVALPLTYTTNHHLGGPLAPVDDDQTLRNDITVTRTSGGSQQVTKTTGALQIAAPPTGVGRYTDTVTVNCLSNAQALDQAGWRVWIGTYDGARFPSIKLNMNVLPLAQRTQVMALTVGSRITITSPPAWLPPDQIDLLVVGWKEPLSTFQWDIELICQPYGPYRVGVWDSATLGRLSPNDGASTVTCTSGATSWSVATSSGPLWTVNAADFPFDVIVEGERVTVTNITGGSSPQTFTVTRSVNGITKAHTAATVDLFQPMIWAM